MGGINNKHYVTFLALYLLVWFLFLCETASIDTVINPTVDPFISFIDFSLEMRRVEVKISVSRNMIELSVEHPDYLCALIVHNGLQLLIPQNLSLIKKAI